MNPQVVAKRRSDDAGFTLPELLITIAILSIVMVALAGAFIAVVKTNQTTNDRIGQSHDAQLVANYLVQDAQSANGAGVSTTALCGASGTVVLSLTWSAMDSSFNQSSRSVSYTLSGPAGGQTLTRWTCGGPGGSAHTTVSHNVLSVAAPTCTNSSASTACVANSLGLVLDVTEATGAANSYLYHLNAAFRDSFGAPSAQFPTFSSLPLIALGAGSGTCVSFNGNGTVTLPVGGGAAANCGGNYGNHAGLMDANGNWSFVSSTSSCSGCTNWHSPAPPVADPYASIAPPVVAGSPSAASCSKGGTLSPGIYTNVTLNGDCTLLTGRYEITGSLIGLSGNALTSGQGGVRIYFTSAAASIDPGTQGSVSLTPLIDASPWSKMSIVMPASTASISFAGQGNVTTGGFYAPKATLNLTGQGSDIFSKLIVGALSATGNGIYSVGCSGASGLGTAC